MNISFHGAARTVTGSKHLISLKNSKRLLLDCGMFQGMGRETDELNRNWGFDPKQVDYLVLSHAHIDHSGLIPKLVKDGFTGQVFCTPATKDLAEILLEDSAVIQRADTKFINRKRIKKHLPLFEPMYSVDDAKKCMRQFETRKYGVWFRVSNEIEVMFTDAGHIIGSAVVNLRITENGKTTAITFSGDVGRYRDLILRPPQDFPQADYLILESTYGDKLHEDKQATADGLLQWITHTCVDKKGKLVIPAFSVGRTQEILYHLNHLELEKRLPPITYFVDSPLSLEATAVVKSYPQNFNEKVQQVLLHDKDPFDFQGLTYIHSVDESKAINQYDAPCVIISASGMADAGRVKHHIKNNISDARNTVLLVGYCSPTSLGGKLAGGIKQVNIYGDELEVKCEVGQMHSMSAHGDYNDLCQFIAKQDPSLVKKLFLVHGEYDVQTRFAERLREKGYEVEIPGMNYATSLS